MLRFWVNCETGLRGKDSTKKLDTFSRCWLEPKRCTGSNHSKGPHANLIKLDFHFRKSAGRFCTIQRGSQLSLIFWYGANNLKRKHVVSILAIILAMSHSIATIVYDQKINTAHFAVMQGLASLLVSGWAADYAKLGVRLLGTGMDWGSRVLYVLSSLKMFATVRWVFHGSIQM